MSDIRRELTPSPYVEVKGKTKADRIAEIQKKINDLVEEREKVMQEEEK